MMKWLNSAAASALLMTHRWMGIAGCLLFIAWFLSGIVMMYARMPELSREERLARAPILDLTTARLSPAEAADRAGIRAQRVTVGMHGPRPVYLFSRGRDESIVFADTGETLQAATLEETRDIARTFAGTPTAPRDLGLLVQPDQWTLQDRGRLPMQRFALDDAEGTELYVSVASGEVVLRTTRAERLWAYAGPVTHWVYFTPLRRNGPLWNSVIVWSSVGGCIVSATGLIWGLMRYSPRRRFRASSVSAASPYQGIMKWHHYAGLLFGLVSLTWVYSGLLSMEPFGWFESDGITRQQREAVTGGPSDLRALDLNQMRAAVAAITQSFPPHELTLIAFKGQPYWAADEAPRPDELPAWRAQERRPRGTLRKLERRYASALDPAPRTFPEFEHSAIEQISLALMPATGVAKSDWLTDYDGYYYDARGARPLPVLRVQYQDAQNTWIYLSPSRGDIVGRFDRVTRLQRWLYHGLHSLDAPFLYFKRPLWDAVVIVLSLGGLASAITALLPAWRRLRKLVTR